MKHELSKDDAYAQWLGDLKERVRAAQLKAAVRVNAALLEFYWELGRDIVEKQRQAQWGDGFLKCLSDDLSAEFPDLKGFSRRNLEHVRRWYLFWSDDRAIAKQAASQLEEKCEKEIFQVPWWHHVVILRKTTSRDEALFYVRKTIENNWSRSVLTHQIESGLHRRAGQAVSNFEATLPAPQSDLARETLKDPYTFDFLTLTERRSPGKGRQLKGGATTGSRTFLSAARGARVPKGAKTLESKPQEFKEKTGHFGRGRRLYDGVGLSLPQTGMSAPLEGLDSLTGTTRLSACSSANRKTTPSWSTP